MRVAGRQWAADHPARQQGLEVHDLLRRSEGEQLVGLAGVDEIHRGVEPMVAAVLPDQPGSLGDGGLGLQIGIQHRVDLHQPGFVAHGIGDCDEVDAPAARSGAIGQLDQAAHLRGRITIRGGHAPAQGEAAREIDLQSAGRCDVGLFA